MTWFVPFPHSGACAKAYVAVKWPDFHSSEEVTRQWGRRRQTGFGTAAALARLRLERRSGGRNMKCPHL